MLEKLMRKIDENCTHVNKECIVKAYNFAYNAHSEQRRESGEPYIIHPVEVACILADMGLDTSTIAAGLLHDVIEDTEYDYEFVTKEFSEEIARLVEGVTKLGKITYKTKEEQQADNVRKMLLAMAKDIRVILIKLADRLHNLRTLKYMPIEKQKQKAKETLDIYAPLAHRLGMSKIKWELEDLSFRYINPNEYYSLVRKISEKRAEREEYIEKITKELYGKLEDSGIQSEIEGRPKHFYSIYRKMIKKNKTIDQIFDLTAIRVLVNNVRDCYATLGIVHTMYKPMPGRFKDYVAMPKPNMYQSLHTTVIGPQGKPFEIQIRTYEMHRTAEYGIAAHWKYKEGDLSAHQEDLDSKLSWLREILEWQDETSDAEEFMERFKIDLFSDEVFVFTPKGAVISLPYESTPIDFAYKIHTDIGHRCIGAKVNGKMVPLDYHLSTGEIIEVLTSPTPKGPNIQWINMTKSNQAKSKIRAWFRKAKREENIVKGKELLEKEAKRQGFNFKEYAKGKVIEKLLSKYHMKGEEDLYASVGAGATIPSVVVSKLVEYYNSEEKSNIVTLEEEEKEISKYTNSKESNKQRQNNYPGVVVKGMKNLLVRFAKCCNPVPGDEIIGYITKGRGVSVHRKDCKNLVELVQNEPEKIVAVSWGTSEGAYYIAEIQIKGDDKPGLLSEVMEGVVKSGLNLYAVNAKTSKIGTAVINVKLKITSREQLDNLMKNIRKFKGVTEVYRVKK
ncbi:RelA/SpoT family protein [Haloimpatiens massiliensis]|uniref:RelA/SpoT family protein n=1 Tax=Haloimpatiens massiliensis TaxID=1658110 RepID=UPI000C849ACC|nr:bifunctional (p)ppGpp synthetase/guanosine-3',5'-bis(diphosphate) 3'-pyrophosphohydrolase [Haloimpatiens massiliensis]